MSFLERVFPQPALSVVIFGLWIVLASSLSPGPLLTGGVLAVFIPWITRSFWPDRPWLSRPLTGLLLFARVMADIVAANWQVARLVIGPLRKLKPDFVEVPLAIGDPFVATLLGSIVSLTPGTVSVEIDRERRILLVHALNVEDKGKLIATIRARYETPLKETFKC